MQLLLSEHSSGHPPLDIHYELEVSSSPDPHGSPGYSQPLAYGACQMGVSVVDSSHFSESLPHCSCPNTTFVDQAATPRLGHPPATLACNTNLGTRMIACAVASSS
ncbi:hypothetical protein PAXRUDRAFT_726668 [Paxillus rubicundulus Ve08.2h10]|uniref:Uncharacterized protein n=1 Tax=Paxillus rubicundulus Ve08.2h10 TaxID=930991 RepID=A0A0D0DR97_9AGAM|nr:hypothetical protein PAXRUDRAFT_726668 [Paxillus rubicundulus Ve08.2h10]